MSARAAVKPSAARITPAPEAPRVWGRSPAERLERVLPRLGIERILGPDDPWPESGHVLLLRGDVVYDDAILDGLVAQPDVLMVRVDEEAEDGGDGDDALAAHVDVRLAEAAHAWLQGRGEAPAGLARRDPVAIGQAYRGRLRKREAPYCLPVTAANVRAVEWRMYMGAYKGVTDLVTKYVWPVPAMWATRACVRLGLSPNMVTFASAVLVLLALWLFWRGDYGWGLLAAWGMTFLDTVDGKLARVTLTSSRFGNVFDHGIDLVHPPFWYLVWGLALADAGHGLPAGWLGPTLWIVFGGYVLGRLLEGYFLHRFGIQVHVWRRVDSLFRLVSARRNPNLILLTLALIAGRPDLGLLAVAVWTVVSDGVHVAQIAQAELAKARGLAIASWLRAAA